jgi:hypothetical protein
MYVFKSLTGYTVYGGYENGNAHFLIIMGNGMLMLVILICTWLRKQNYEWTVPYPIF